MENFQQTFPFFKSWAYIKCFKFNSFLLIFSKFHNIVIVQKYSEIWTDHLLMLLIPPWNPWFQEHMEEMSQRDSKNLMILARNVANPLT